MTEKEQPITGRQLAAARDLLGLFQSEVADWSHISESTLKRFEAEKKALPATNNVFAVIRVLEQKGVEFLPRGVQLR
ncbi:MAG: helix-turn-helix transcriptional regulator [Xanthobacteraceae bacterium]|nr:helix-turn-helix transcriptional regulator [Xanthobacteraceae bacterium]